MQDSSQNTRSQGRFEQEWKEAHCRIFRFCEPAHGKRWLPEQVFQEGFTFSFICPYFYFRRKVFGALKQILCALSEDAFMIGPAGSSVEEEKEQLVYPTTVEYEQYLQGADEPQFFLGIQPLELYLQGRRDDWGIVASESYNIAIIGYRSEAAARAFRGHFVDDPNNSYVVSSNDARGLPAPF